MKGALGFFFETFRRNLKKTRTSMEGFQTPTKNKAKPLAAGHRVFFSPPPGVCQVAAPRWEWMASRIKRPGDVLAMAGGEFHVSAWSFLWFLVVKPLKREQ